MTTYTAEIQLDIIRRSKTNTLIKQAAPPQAPNWGLYNQNLTNATSFNRNNRNQAVNVNGIDMNVQMPNTNKTDLGAAVGGVAATGAGIGVQKGWQAWRGAANAANAANTANAAANTANAVANTGKAVGTFGKVLGGAGRFASRALGFLAPLGIAAYGGSALYKGLTGDFRGAGRNVLDAVSFLPGVGLPLMGGLMAYDALKGKHVAKANNQAVQQAYNNAQNVQRPTGRMASY